MELDKRIKEGKRPLTCFDLKEAEKFIGEDGYFAHEMEAFENLDRCYFSRLLGFDTCDKSIPFAVANASRDYEFFIPAEWVKPEDPEKKYRAFSLNEFLERYKIGDTVTFRMKKDEHIPEAECLIEYKRMITGYEILPEDKDTPGKGSILLGGCPPTGLARLFEFYEIKNSYYCPAVWQPFGIIDESQE